METRSNGSAPPTDAGPRVLPRADRALDRTLALWTAPRRFAGFKRFAMRHFPIDAEATRAIEELGADELDRLGRLLGFDEARLAQLVAIYLGLPFRLRLDAERIDFRLLPRHFCANQLVVSLRQEHDRPRFALGNPFRWALAHAFETHQIGVEEADFVIVTPQEVRRALGRARRRPSARRRPRRSPADQPTIDASQPLEPLQRILFLHTLPASTVG